MSLEAKLSSSDLLDILNKHAEECNLDMRFQFIRVTENGTEFHSELTDDCNLAIGSEMDFANLSYKDIVCSADSFTIVANALDIFMVSEFGLGGGQY